MQAFFKIVVPVALTATALGTVTGYSLHKLPAEPLKTCAAAVKINQLPADREHKPSLSPAWQHQPSVMDSSWRNWPSLTDF
jgi:hypothetical protein